MIGQQEHTKLHFQVQGTIHDFGQMLKYIRKPCNCVSISLIESPLGTVFQLNITQTEQNKQY